MKKSIFTIFTLLFGGCLCVSSQKMTVEQIRTFYQDADIDCYKEIIQQGMDAFDKWLVDTLYSKTTLEIWFKPSNIRLQEHDTEHIVRLIPYDMESYGINDNIYDHLIIDSVYSVSLIPLDKRKQPLGITDVQEEPYSFCSFDRKNMKKDSYSIWFKKCIRKLLKTARKKNADALVQIEPLYNFTYYGYIKDRKLFMVSPRWRKPMELSIIANGLLEISPKRLQSSGRVLRPTDKEFWDSNGMPSVRHLRRSGNTPKNEIRMCGF